MANQTGSGVKGGTDESDPLPHVALIYNVVDEVESGEARDLLADQEVMQTAHEIGAALERSGFAVDLLPIRELADVSASLAGYDRGRTLVFNLCENLGGRASDEPKVPQLLQVLGFRYTGSPPYTLATCLDKARAKRLLHARGVPTATFQVSRTDRAPMRVPYPAIVKPVAEDASAGIGRDSVVTSREAYRRQVAYVLESYRQPALVEAFISGREFNVSVWGNGTARVLPLAELDFGDWPELTRVCHFHAKWEVDAPEYSTTAVRCPAEVEPDLADAIRDVARRAYAILGCRDYARVDLRVKDGVPYVLEVNPNPCLAPDAGFARSAGVGGYEYSRMVAQIARWAWERRRRARPRRLPGVLRVEAVGAYGT